MRTIVLLLVLPILASCGSSPKTHYFTLAAVPDQSRQASPMAANVTVAAVNVPSSLDRREMLRATGANTVSVTSEELWTAPLGDMIRRILSEDLATRLPPEHVILPNSPVPPGTEQIVVSIAEFGPGLSGETRLNGSWTLLSGNGQKTLMRRDIALAVPSPAPGGTGEAAAMSQLLGQLASQIAEALAGSQRKDASAGAG